MIPRDLRRVAMLQSTGMGFFWRARQPRRRGFIMRRILGDLPPPEQRRGFIMRKILGEKVQQIQQAKSSFSLMRTTKNFMANPVEFVKQNAIKIFLFLLGLKVIFVAVP